MKRKAVLFLVISLIVLMCSNAALAAEPGLDNFTNVNTYENGHFTDVNSSEWYSANVATAYRLGLMKGSSATYFNAEGNVTIAEAIALACRLHSIYYGDGQVFTQGTPWHGVYVTYALKNGIISGQYTDYDKKATRSEFAVILAGALPDEALTVINTIGDGAIPDVSTTASYQSAVYKLYRAGILTGNDAAGTFAPLSNISRSQVSAIVTRMANTSLRQHKSLYAGSGITLTQTQILSKCSSAVVFVEFYDENDEYISSCSGFLISDTGDVVICYQALEGASAAYVFCENEDKGLRVKSILAYDVDKNIAILHIDREGLDYLEMGDSGNITVGQKVYSLSYQFDNNCEQTIYAGTVTDSNCDDVFDNFTGIQTNISAASANGFAGGALLNEYGKVIGLNMGMDGENILVTPIYDVYELYQEARSSSNWVDSLATYDFCNVVPDYGAIFDETPVWQDTFTQDGKTYHYFVYEYNYWNNADPQELYEQLLEECGFSYYTQFESAILDNDVMFNMYKNDDVGISIGHSSDEIAINIAIPENYTEDSFDIYATPTYDICSDVPDFGAIFEAEPYKTWYEYDDGEYCYYYDYDYWDIVNYTGLYDDPNPIELYKYVLTEWGYEYFGEIEEDGTTYYVYKNNNMYMAIGYDGETVEISFIP